MKIMNETTEFIYIPSNIFHKNALGDYALFCFIFVVAMES